MTDSLDLNQLATNIKRWGREFGFQQVGITDTDLSADEPRFQAWLEQGYQGSMEWLSAHGTKRTRPAELIPGTLRVISFRMDYLPGDTQQIQTLKDPTKAYISRYTLGRDYHKLIRKRLSQIADKINAAIPDDYPLKGEHRAFVDSAPVMERPLAEKAGLGWTGKHTLILNSTAGSWFFFGGDIQLSPPPHRHQPRTQPMWRMQRLLKSLPHRCIPYPLRTGCASLYFLSHHRKQRPYSTRIP